MTFKVIKENILRNNDEAANNIRFLLDRENIFMLNIISSPGSGKTSLLEKACPLFIKEGIKAALITGDCYTSRDAERLDILKLPVIQINTGNACHIDASLVQRAINETSLDGLDLIIVENVGNLVCPAEFDIGEDDKIVMVSTAEGHDKPEKYPLIIMESSLFIMNKIDLIPYVNFDINLCIESVQKINPKIDIIKISCKTGEAVSGFVDWIKIKIKQKKERKSL
ncbi:Hydrogenase expression/synthesis, HypB [Candidatus Omnitrophus magneticus]|uniref:Hydrogenase expression/synthesis, HypB n=1 Tax=Candidatus Omnitrophus magneticus TaxID=1609969 RepID=A0A0F0CU07_9BACT|nr:Hydrogenase expression/synthesis, HypB [Candidatus Omnitrophus magneticus]